MGRSERARGIEPGEYKNPFSTKGNSGKYDRRGRRIGSPSSVVPGATGGGSVIRAFGTEYEMDDPVQKAAYEREQAEELRRQRGKGNGMSDIRGGDGLKPDGTRFAEPPTTPTRDVPKEDGSKGTQTGPSQAKPGDMGAFMKMLQEKHGIKFNFNEQDRNGYQSNALPGTNSAMGPVADGDAYGKMLNATKGTKGMGPLADGGVYGDFLDGRTGAPTAVGAQAGDSPSADVGDQSRAISIPGSRRRGNNRDGMGFNDTDFSGDEPSTESLSSPGFSARSRAFLDYEGGSAMALRAAEAAQGTIKQNGKLYGMSKDGTATEINQAGADILKRDGNAIASQQFLNDYKYVPAGPSETESADVMKPETASTAPPNSNIGPVADTEQYGKILDATKGMKGMGPLADGETYGLYLDGREPLMRG